MDELYYLAVASHNDQRACPFSFSLVLSVCLRAVFSAHEKYRDVAWENGPEAEPRRP